MIGGGIPDLVGHGVATVRESCRGLGERQRGSLRVGEIRGLTPCGDGEKPLVGLARLPGR